MMPGDYIRGRNARTVIDAEFKVDLSVPVETLLMRDFGKAMANAVDAEMMGLVESNVPPLPTVIAKVRSTIRCIRFRKENK